MKIRFDLYDEDLPLGKVLSFSILKIAAKSVFQNESNYFPQTQIRECEYECEYEP